MAHALLRRRLPAAAARRRARAALRRPDAARPSAARCERVRARRTVACGRSRGSRRAARASCARRRPETLGAEWMLLHAFAWRRAARRDGARPAAAARLRLDAVPPPALDPRPGARATGDPALRALAEKIAPLRLAVRDDAAPRGERADPDVRPAPLLRRLHRQAQPRPAPGGARRARADRHRRPGRAAAARAGRRTSSATAGWRACSTASRSRSAASRPASRSAARRSLRRHDLVDRAHRRRGRARARRRAALPLPDPGVRAVHVPDGQLRRAGRPSPTGCPTRALFSTELLRDYFRRHALGVYAAGTAPGDAASAAFQNAITAVSAAPAPRSSPAGAPRRLLFYARPEAPRRPQHVRAGRAGARARGRARRVRAAGRCTASAPSEARPADRPRRGATLELLPRAGPGRLRRACCASTTSAWR